jgi:3-oxoacyl-[acyl-carrier protein] reductase
MSAAAAPARKTPERWAVVTGASSGIGAATALVLAERGWNVVVHCRKSRDAAETVAATIEQTGGRALVLEADLADPAAGPALAAAAWERTGGVAAWVHLAGADLLTVPAARLAFDAKLELATRVDLWGTVHTCREVGRRMLEANGGAIVTVGWDQAATGMAGDSGELFAAVKGGVMAFTRALARSLAPGVRVNCIAPGWIKTAWGERAPQHWHERVLRETPLGRWGAPHDVAHAIAFLVSEEANFVTGQVIAVNGGAVTL